jgi:hypothetical protein
VSRFDSLLFFLCGELKGHYQDPPGLRRVKTRVIKAESGKKAKSRVRGSPFKKG